MNREQERDKIPAFEKARDKRSCDDIEMIVLKWLGSMEQGRIFLPDFLDDRIAASPTRRISSAFSLIHPISPA